MKFMASVTGALLAQGVAWDGEHLVFAGGSAITRTLLDCATRAVAGLDGTDGDKKS